MTHLPERIHHLHPGPMKGLHLAGTRIATGGSDGTVRVMAVTGEHIGSNASHRDIVNSVAIDERGWVISGSRDRTVRVFDPAVGRSYVVGEHDHWVMSVAWSDDGSHLVSGSEDGTVGIWEPEGASVTRTSLGAPVNAVDWRGDVIAAVTGDGSLHLLGDDGAVRAAVGGADQIPWSVAVSPDATHVAWTGRDRMLRITDLSDGTTVAVPAHDDQVWSVAWDAAGRRLLTTSADGTYAIWDPDGTAVERVRIGTWIRRGLFRGVEVYLATERGELVIHSSDGLPARSPIPIVLPERPESCGHWDPQVTDGGYRPRCAECGSFEEARLCVTCGHVGCCESQLAHATKHWLATGHPTTIPTPTRDLGWRWCYADDMYVKRT